MKNILKLSSVAICLIMLTFTSNLIAEGGGIDKDDDVKKDDWLQYSSKTKKPVATTLSINVDGKVVEGVVVGDIKINQEFVYLKCCGPNRNKDSWCNLALQEKGC